MIGIKFAKPLEPDTLTRTVMRTVTREVEEQVAHPVEREITRMVQEPVYTTIKAEDGTTHQIVAGYTPKEVTDTVQDVEYRTEKKTVAEEVPEQERYDNPAPNTYTKYREASQWCNKNNAKIVDCGEYYEVQAIPEPTAEELAAAELAQAKANRAVSVASITVTVDGMTFDGDEKAQERMARTVTAATATGASMDDTTTWVLHDNTVATVTIRQLATALRLAGEEQTRLWTIPYEASYTPAEAA